MYATLVPRDSDDRHHEVIVRPPDGDPDAVSLLDRLDPRQHLAAAIGWSVLVIVALSSLVAGNFAASTAEAAARRDTERLLAQFATQIQHGLGMNLQTRLSVVQATASQIAASSERGDAALRRHLDAVQAQFPEFAWLGVADTQGQVMAATGDVLRGASVAQRPWFTAAATRPFLGDVHAAVLLEKHLPRAPDGQPLRFVDAAAPIRHAGGDVVGVVGAHLSWMWIERLQAELLGSLDSHRTLELLLTNREGLVLVGPKAWLGRTLGAADDLTERGAYIVGRHLAKDAGDGWLGWSVTVRQAAGPALASVRDLHRTVFGAVMLAGVLSALAAIWTTRWLLDRLGVLARQANAVRRGERKDIAVPPGRDEVGRIGVAMAELVDHLQREKAALAQLNAELDARVAERTARIERMADEARHAAVTRERLRLARDLHDTLAHSLMALLQQIRLLRKLRHRMPAEEYEGELGRAEEVAASGLAQARAAITQIRHGTVREQGLGAALKDLLARFAERTGIEATLNAAGAVANLADERAETLFRIAEEALRNVERHAQAHTVTLSLSSPVDEAGNVTDARAMLCVKDDGVGFDPAAPCPGHYGMLGIREQAALIDARLSIDSRRGAGTEICLEFDA